MIVSSGGSESGAGGRLDIQELDVRFEGHRGTTTAVEGVSYHLDEGETLGLVGESGSGKSVTQLAILGLLPSRTAVVNAKAVTFGGRDLLSMPERQLRRLRGKEISMIFQDPMTALNPLLTIGQQLTEVFEFHDPRPRREARRAAIEALAEVGIPAPDLRFGQYPHELSGGMRQRVMIAMALLLEPRILIADEPTTALDVTIQAQILELLRDQQARRGMSILLITHDLGVVAGLADRIQVMYAGRLAETAEIEEFFESPLHPYSRGLLGSIPRLHGDPSEALQAIPGQPPDPSVALEGCPFAPRCEMVIDRCRSDRPELEPFSTHPSGELRRSACFRAMELLPVTDVMPSASSTPEDFKKPGSESDR